MRALANLVRRLRWFGRRGELEDRLDEEIRFHLAQQIEKNRRAGMVPDEARRHALVQFGGVEQVRERTRDEFRAALIEHLGRDIRYSLRSLRRHPGFTAMALLSLAIGIGANAAIVGVSYAVLFRQPTFDHPEALVNVYETESRRGFNPMSHPNIEDLRRSTEHIFSGIAASTFAPAQINHGNTVGTVMGEAVTGGAFALLGIQPALGRAIQPDDDVGPGGHPVVMLGYGYWRRAFGEDPHVIGRTLDMGGRAYTIIGVAPPDYRGGLPLITPAFYVPLTMLDDLMGAEMLSQRSFHNFAVKARLARGVTRTQAEHASSLVAASLTAARPEGWVPGEQFALVPTADVQVLPGVDPLLRTSAGLLIAVVALVLLLACTNLASFLLARALDRGKEVGVRRALGATRGALARQFLVESALLAMGGAAGGLVVALVLVDLLVSLNLPLPYGLRLDLHLGLDTAMLFDWKVLAFTAAVGVVAGIFLGLGPAVQGTRADVASTLATSTRGSDTRGTLRWRSALVVAQIAMSLVLLVGASMFLRSWQNMLAVDPGFGRAPISLLSILMPATPRSDPQQRTRQLLERFETLPGVEAVGLVWPLPLEFSSSHTDFTIDGLVPPAGREAFRADRAFVGGDFFDALGIRIIEGRGFDVRDGRDTQPVAVISRAMARRYWPDGGALGRRLRRPDPAERDLIVIGIASDINVRSLGEAPRDLIYESQSQSAPLPGFTFIARTALDPARMSLALVDAGRQIDPELRVVQATTMTQHLAVSRLPSQIASVLLVAFAALGMALAAVGVDGMVRYTVAMRRREIGIRMALGADAAGVARQLAKGSVRLVLIGSALGLGTSVLVARFLVTLLFGVGTFDPVALIGAPLVLGVSALLAAYLPARRASRADPLAALRAD